MVSDICICVYTAYRHTVIILIRTHIDVIHLLNSLLTRDTCETSLDTNNLTTYDVQLYIFTVYQCLFLPGGWPVQKCQHWQPGTLKKTMSGTWVFQKTKMTYRFWVVLSGFDPYPLVFPAKEV